MTTNPLYDRSAKVDSHMNLAQRNILRLVSAMLAARPASFVYEDVDGVTSAREATPLSIEVPSTTPNVIVRAYDVKRGQYRTFTLSRILFVAA